MKEREISGLKLERYLLGELPRKEMKEMESLLARDKSLSDRLEMLRSSNDEIGRKYPAAEMTARISRRFEMEKAYSMDKREKQEKETQSFFGRFRIFVPAFSAVLAAAIIIPVLLLNTGRDGTRPKGTASLLIYRKTASGEELLKNGDRAKQGDILQLGYLAGKNKFGAIFSIDGKGNLTWHFPAKIQDDMKLSAGKRALLRESYELDDAPEFERFFFIASDREFILSNIIRNAGILAKEPAGSEVKSRKLFTNEQVIVITLVKRNDL